MAQPDTLRRETAVVRGFETHRSLLTTAAPIHVWNGKDIRRSGSASLLPVLNQAPGVRMEERSPGSYRLSIRGSLLRSPFGVRNCKAYIGGIPLTDAGGNTYLNLPDVQMLQQIEVIKGPAGITYGAGTGGTVLLNEPESGNSKADTGSVQAALQGGSFGGFGAYAAWNHNSEKATLQLQQTHTRTDGYRAHSAFRRSALLWQAALPASTNNQWHFLLLYGNLHYQTPGALTEAQWQLDPRASRPRAGSLPSAIEQNAGVWQQTLLAGAQYRQNRKHWQIQHTVFGAYTGFANPFITNYETRFEKSAGVRTVWRYTNGAFSWIGGGEAAVTGSHITNYGNRGGEKDSLQSKDDVRAIQAFGFSQLQFTFSRKWLAEAGFSLNHFGWQYQRHFPLPAGGRRNFHIQLLPRAALLYRLAASFSVYGSIARGYSPPTLAELRPDNQVLNTTLQPEAGTNYETGFRGSFANGKWFIDVSAYHFRLGNTIVRRNSTNGDYFVNAGFTRQNGLEAYLQTTVTRKSGKPFLRLFSSLTLNHYRFGEYVVGSAVYNGNRITGTPGHTVVAGADITFARNWNGSLTASHTGSLPLTDDNSVFASDYYLFDARLNRRFTFRKTTGQVFVVGNNLLNQLYSLGNDLNAAGKRYYNAAPKRNFTVGLLLNRAPD